MNEDRPKVSKRLIWIIVTALLGVTVTAIVTSLLKEVQKEVPKLEAWAWFNRYTARTKDGVMLTNVSLRNSGDLTLYDVEISGDFTPSSGFRILEVQEAGVPVKGSTKIDLTEVSPHFSASCAYLNPGDSWGISVWHLGITHGTTVYARCKGLSYREDLNTTFEDIRNSCFDLYLEIPENRRSELYPQYCKDRFGFGEER